MEEVGMKPADIPAMLNEIMSNKGISLVVTKDKGTKYDYTVKYSEDMTNETVENARGFTLMYTDGFQYYTFHYIDEGGELLEETSAKINTPEQLEEKLDEATTLKHIAQPNVTQSPSAEAHRDEMDWAPTHFHRNSIPTPPAEAHKDEIDTNTPRERSSSREREPDTINLSPTHSPRDSTPTPPNEPETIPHDDTEHETVTEPSEGLVVNPVTTTKGDLAALRAKVEILSHVVENIIDVLDRLTSITSDKIQQWKRDLHPQVNSPI